MFDTSFEIETLWDRNSGGTPYDPENLILISALSFHCNHAIAFFDADGNVITDHAPNGIVDTHVGGGSDWAMDLEIDRGATSAESDDTIVVCGYAYGGSSYGTDASLARYKFDSGACVLDTTFDTDGKLWFDFDNAHDRGEALTLLPNGQIATVGYAPIDGVQKSFVSYFNWNDGSVDSNFGDNGKVIFNFDDDHEAARDVTVDSEGNLLVAGHAYINSQAEMFIARVLTDLSGHTG